MQLKTQETFCFVQIGDGWLDCLGRGSPPSSFRPSYSSDRTTTGPRPTTLEPRTRLAIAGLRFPESKRPVLLHRPLPLLGSIRRRRSRRRTMPIKRPRACRPRHCPSWARTRTLLIQSQACCQLHQGASGGRKLTIGTTPRNPQLLRSYPAPTGHFSSSSSASKASGQSPVST